MNAREIAEQIRREAEATSSPEVLCDLDERITGLLFLASPADRAAIYPVMDYISEKLWNIDHSVSPAGEERS